MYPKQPTQKEKEIVVDFEEVKTEIQNIIDKKTEEFLHMQNGRNFKGLSITLPEVTTNFLDEVLISDIKTIKKTKR